MTPTAVLDEASASWVLEAAHQAVRVRRAAEVAEMRVTALWVAMHVEPRSERDPMTSPGGEGSPAVREYALPELAMARETHALTTRALAADTLDLQRRLPRVRAVVEALECEPWVARKVATLSRPLPAATVGIVDAAVAAATAPALPAPGGTSGRHPTATPTSSTTTAPPDSPTPRPGSTSPHQPASTSTPPAWRSAGLDEAGLIAASRSPHG